MTNLFENLFHVGYEVKEASAHEDSSGEARRKGDNSAPPFQSA